jgi:uncharacterized protein
MCLRRFALATLAALLCAPAVADLFSAQTAYQQGDYERALHDYRELAELGQATAQYNLASMYARGEGTRQSDIYAYAWATLAAESGESRGQALADLLRPQLAPGSEKIANDIAAPFRRAELDARLMPRIEGDSLDAGACVMVRQPSLPYPAEAAGKGIQGSVFAEFVVMRDGRARHPHLVYAIPLGVFEDTVRRGMLTAQYRARPPGATPAHCRLMIRFVEATVSKANYPRLVELANVTEKKAEAGDLQAQTLYGMLLTGLPQLGHGPKDGLPWFLKAAQAGARTAQYEVGASLLDGVGCQCEATKGEVWLRKAAEADQPDAQVTLAQYALRGAPDAKDTAQAKVWLERAVANSSRDGMLYLSALLAATPVAELRDPKRSLLLLDAVKSDLPGDPAQFEIRAAAQASAGAFADAVKSEQRAISMATRLGWDLGPLNERLTSYQNQQPWFGNLLEM